MEISVSAETESHAESGIRLSAETEITPKETTRFRPKSETETESSCDLIIIPTCQDVDLNKPVYICWFNVNKR